MRAYGMNWLRQKWYNVSIQTKSLLLMGSMLAAAWVLVALVVVQLRTFSGKSEIIMNEYMDITGFMNTFSAENVCLEAYIRPVQPLNAREDYLAAIQSTNRQLDALRPDLQADRREEYALKRAICNAMEHYRNSQGALLRAETSSKMIEPYLSLKTQAAYIDDYTRDLLHSQMIQGGAQWQEIDSANAASSQRFVGFLAISTVLMVLILRIFTHSILDPLAALGRAADTIGTGRYDAPPLVVRGDDEVGRAAKSFNLMQAEIRRTIQALERQSEMEKRLLEKEVETAQMHRKLQEGRFAQLQSQINPHFLFNTLSTIAALAREEDAPLSEDLILRLSNFFRYSLESDERMVALGREIQLLRDYMELQETRYGDRIIMEVRADPALSDIPVPKFILQPLVENSILHGLRSRTGGGQIRVRAFRGRRGVTITVTDNGCGFDPKALQKRAGHHSVGLDNIRERMVLSGGGLDIFSRPGLGTCARITVREEVRHDQDPGGRG